MIHILFFGKLADVAELVLGSNKIDYELATDQHTIPFIDLRNKIIENTPTLAEELNQPSNLCAVNQEMQTNLFDTIVNDGDEVAFMSPLSGG